MLGIPEAPSVTLSEGDLVTHNVSSSRPFQSELPGPPGPGIDDEEKVIRPGLRFIAPGLDEIKDLTAANMSQVQLRI